MHKTQHTRKPLAVHRETLRTLTPHALGRAAGGITATAGGAPDECSTDTWTQNTASALAGTCQQSQGCA